MPARPKVVYGHRCSPCERAAQLRREWKLQVQKEFKASDPKFRVPTAKKKA